MLDFLEFILEAFNITPSGKKTKASRIIAYVLIVLFVAIAIFSLVVWLDK